MASDAPALVTLHLVDSIGQRVSVPFDIWLARGVTPGDPSFAPADLKDPAALMGLLVDPGADPVARWLAQALGDELRQARDGLAELIAGAPANDEERQQRGVAIFTVVLWALDDLCSRDGLYDPQRFAGVTLDAETQKLVAARAQLSANEDHSDFFLQLNRSLLETALPKLFGTCRKIASHDGLTPASLAGGAYALASTEFPDAGVEIEVAPGATVAAEVPYDGWLLTILSNESGGAPHHLRVDPRPAEVQRQVVARYRSQDSSFGYVILPRPGVASADVAAALARARQQLQSPAATPPAGAAPADADRWRAQHGRMVDEAVEVLTAFGEAADARLLVDAGAGLDITDRWNYFAAAAYLEARLGILDGDGGTLARELAGSDRQRALAAAAAFHMHGSARGDDRLIEMANDPTLGYPVDALYLLRDCARPEVLAAMRAQLPRFAKQDYYPFPLIEYLIAYGEPDDQRAVLSRPLGSYTLLSLMGLFEDPLAAAQAELEHQDFGYLAVESHVLDTFANGAELATQLDNSVYWTGARAANPTNPDDSLAEEQGHTWQNTFHVARATRVPHTFVADIYCGQPDFLNDEWPLVPTVEWNRLDSLVQRFVGPGLSDAAMVQFDWAAHDDLAKALDAAKASDHVIGVDLLLLRHKIGGRAGYIINDGFHDRIERRPFLLRSSDGGIDGVLGMQPWFVERTLRIAVGVQVAKHELVAPFFGSSDPRAYSTWAYYVDNGHKLIASVRLRRGDAPVAIAERGTLAGGGWLYEAELDRAELAGLYLEIDVAYLEQRRTLVFDLFGGDLAYDRRRLTERAAERAAAVARAPSDPTLRIAWGDHLRALGALDDAWAQYRKAIELDPQRTGLWTVGAQMFAENGRHDRAAALLQSLLTAGAADDDVNRWRDLAGENYLAGDYLRAAAASDQLLALASDSSSARLMRAACAFLCGDWAGAAQRIADWDDRPDAALPLWLLAARNAGAPADAALAALTALHDRLDDKDVDKKIYGVLTRAIGLGDALDAARGPFDRCRAHCWAAHLSVWSGDAASAADQFAQALATLQHDQLEYRIAAARAGTP
jgi:tetratricopeptide (TPR) repeat protein